MTNSGAVKVASAPSRAARREMSRLAATKSRIAPRAEIAANGRRTPHSVKGPTQRSGPSAFTASIPAAISHRSSAGLEKKYADSHHGCR